MGRLSFLIENVVDAYYNGGIDILGPPDDPPDDESGLSDELREKLHQLTDTALHSSQNLTALDDVPYGALMSQLYAPLLAQANKDDLNVIARVWKLHWQKLEEELGWELARMANVAEERILDLAGMAVQQMPSGKAAGFLRRVARCCQFGFDAECLIMCRSVIDAELLSEISGDECISVLGQRQYFDLGDRIEAARRLRLLSFELAQEAHNIRKLGNKAVHGDPDVAKGIDSLGIIKNTLKIVEELNRGGSGTGEAGQR